MNTVSLVKSEEKSCGTINYYMFFWYSLLFLYAFNFMGVGEFFPLMAIPYSIYAIFNSKFSKGFIISLIILFFFSSIYVMIVSYYNYYSAFGLIGRLIYPTLFFILGYKIIGDNIDYKKIKSFLFVILTGLSLYGLLSLMKTLNLYGSMDNMMRLFGGRNIISLWGSGFISATALTAYLSFSLASFPMLFTKDINKIKRCILLFLFVASIYTIFQTSSRTGVLIILISIISTILFSEKMNTKKILTVFFSLCAISGVTLLYNLNLLGLKKNFESTFLFNRLISSGSDNSRFDAWRTVFSNLINYPIGGKGINLNVGYAHNLWLDIGYESGVIPFVLLGIFTLISIIAIIKLLKSKHPTNFKIIIICMLSAFTVIFMLEPVLQGLTVYFMFFCFLIGVIHKVNYLNVKKCKQ